MADIFPATPRAGAPRSERRVFDALARLRAEWTVVHSVAWQGERDGGEGDGEGDFCVLHPEHGLGVLEVKGGGVRVDPRAASGWTTVDAHGVEHVIKDPFRQATATKHVLLGALRGLDPFLPGRVRLWHAVVLPDVVVESSIGMQPRGLVLDARDLEHPSDALGRVVQHWGVAGASSWTRIELERVRDLLAPRVDLRRVLVADLDEAVGRLVDLTAQQYAVLEAMRHNRRLLVRGGAGTGKSLLGLERARRVARDGARALLVCFNAPLAAHLAESAARAPEISVSTFHVLAAKLAARVGVQLPPDFDDPRWGFAASRAFAGARTGESLFDAVIVDEGQDFSGEWINDLERLVAASGTMIVMADSHQQLYARDFATSPSWPVVDLDQNCRNTLPIARWVACAAGDAPPLHGVAGREPVVIELDTRAGMPAVVSQVVIRLTEDEAVPPSRIVVLTDSRERADSLIGRAVGQWAFARPGQLGVATETIHRFKGLEADAVVLVLDRPRPSASIDALLYVGMSRARAFLVVVVARPAIGRLLEFCRPSS